MASIKRDGWVRAGNGLQLKLQENKPNGRSATRENSAVEGYRMFFRDKFIRYTDNYLII
jgi:hypothetical protein